MTKTSLKPFTGSYRVRFKPIAKSASGSRITGEQVYLIEQKSKANHKRPTKDEQVISFYSLQILPELRIYRWRVVCLYGQHFQRRE